MLRLIRYSLGKPKFKEEDIFYRDLGRLLSELRDAHAAIEVLVLLSDKFEELKEHPSTAVMENKLLEREKKILKEKEAEGNIKIICQQLRKSKNQPDHWPEIPDRFTSVKSGLKEVHERGYNGLADCRINPEKDCFHEWRKQVKYLWYQLLILKPIWSPALEEWATQIYSLSGYLGVEHDLANFEDVINESDIREELSKASSRLVEYVQHYREELQSEAVQLGLKLYSEDPEKFINRLESQYNAEFNFQY